MVKRIKLVIGAGGVRGFFSLPIISRLLDAGVEIEAVSGSSIGSIIGSYLALNKELESFVSLANSSKQELKRLFDYKLSKQGLIKGDRIYKTLKRVYNNYSIRKVRLDLYINSYNITKRRLVYFSNLNSNILIANAIMASISIPGLFRPFLYNRNYYVDASFIDPLPISPFRIFVRKSVPKHKKQKTQKIVVFDFSNVELNAKSYSLINIIELVNLERSSLISEMKLNLEGNNFNIYKIKPLFRVRSVHEFLKFDDWKKYYRYGLKFLEHNENKLFDWIG